MFVGSLESEHTSRHGTKGKWIDAEFHKEKKSEFIDYSRLVFFPFFSFISKSFRSTISTFFIFEKFSISYDGG